MNGALNREEIERRVVSVACEVLVLPEGTVNVKVDSIIELAEDSLDQMRLYMALEDEFGGTIQEEQLESIETFNDVVDYIVSMDQNSPVT
jgi:acyl carrier protein